MRVCVSVCLCVFVCVCACVCLHEEGLQEHYAEEDFEGTKISIFEDIHFTRRKIVFLYFNIEYGYQYLAASAKNGLLNDSSQKILKAMEKRKFNCIIISHLNINSIKRRFGLL